jgi:hypothetical protein
MDMSYRVHCQQKAGGVVPEAPRPILSVPPRPRVPRVIIPQYPTEMHGGRIVRRDLDLSDALRFGELVELLDHSAKPWDPDAIEQMDQALTESSADDWLLCVGNPTMIGLAAAALGSIHGGINLLQWQSRSRRYESVRVVFTEEDGTQVLPGQPPEDEERR